MRGRDDTEGEVCDAAKELAGRRDVSAGEIGSRMLRDVLTGRLHGAPGHPTVPAVEVGGFRPFAPRGQVVTNDAVNQLRDDEGI